MEKNKELWKIINKLWDSGETYSEQIKKNKEYWNGKYTLSSSIYFNAQEKTAANIITPIIETKVDAILDAQFTVAVLPDSKSFVSIEDLKQMQAVADIYTQEILNIFQNNNFQKIQELVLRNSFIAGFGSSQTIWDSSKDVRGQVKITSVDVENIRWDKNATCIDDLSYIGYKIQMNPFHAKDKYCRNEDETFDEEKCKLIDKITKDISGTQGGDKNAGGVISWIHSLGDNAGQMFSGKGSTNGIKSGKSVELITIFLLDDSIYAPESQDSTEVTEEKQSSQMMYPNGRMIIFSLSENDYLILEDIALPKSFKNLGNIDIFAAQSADTLRGRSEVEDLIPIQDRINGLYAKYRECVANDFSALVCSKEGLNAGDLVKNAILFYEDISPDKPPIVVSNNGIEKGAQLMEIIEKIKQHAYETMRINETMLYGARQAGTTSGEQVEMLQESPLAQMRAKQRNFKQFVIAVAEKCLMFIQENYTVNRLIQLNSLGNQGYASITQDANTGEKVIDIYDELGNAVKTLKTNPDWKFIVDVVAGTEIPRSRKETAQLMDKLITNGVLGSPQDIDIKEMYLRAQDVPNYRAIVSLLKKKGEEEAQKNTYTLKELVMNPPVAKSYTELIDALTKAGFHGAISQMLEAVSINPNKDTTLDDVPVQDVVKQATLKEVGAAAPHVISRDPNIQQRGQEIAQAQMMTDTLAAENKGVPNAIQA